MSSSSSKAPYPSPSARAAARARMKERAAAATKQIETTTDSKADIGDSRPMNVVDSTACSPQFPLTTPKKNTQCLSKVPIGTRPLDASSKKYSRESGRSPDPFSPPRTPYPPFPSPVQSHRMPSQIVQPKEPHDNRDRPFVLPKNRKYQKSSRMGLKLYCGDEDEDAIKRKDEELDAHSVDDDGQSDTPYMPGSEADNRRYCLTWLRNVPKPGSFQTQDAPPKRE
jgi:hypothetical protein